MIRKCMLRRRGKVPQKYLDVTVNPEWEKPVKSRLANWINCCWLGKQPVPWPLLHTIYTYKHTFPHTHKHLFNSHPSRWTKVSPLEALCQLHWLPVNRLIKFKLCVLMYSAHTSRCPKYLTDVLKPAAKYYLRPGLRSSSTNNYILSRLQSRPGERAFSYAGPLAWNSLPADLQNIPDTSTFKRSFKTYLFNSAS